MFYDLNELIIIVKNYLLKNVIVKKKKKNRKKENEKKSWKDIFIVTIKKYLSIDLQEANIVNKEANTTERIIRQWRTVRGHKDQSYRRTRGNARTDVNFVLSRDARGPNAITVVQNCTIHSPVRKWILLNY